MSYEKAVKTPVAQGGLGWSLIDQQEIDAVTAVLKAPEKMFRYLEGSESTRLEKDLEKKTGVKHALFVNSGTSALTCCLAGCGIGLNDEVIVPAYTYIATAAACIGVGAVPIIAEIDESLGLDPEDVERKITPYTKAIILTHMQGVPGRIDAIREIAKKHNLRFIEDCCQSIGATYKGRHTGMTADAFCWSLNYFKIITCGEGGVFFANSDEAFSKAFYQSDPGGEMWNTGMGSTLDSVRPFAKACYRANEICAAIANVQASKLDGMLAKTRELKKTLISHLNTPVSYKLQHVDDPDGDCGISFAMIANTKEICDKFTAALANEGLNVGTSYSDSFPDRHIFSYWQAIIDKTDGDIQNYPWNNPNYKGAPKYSKDMCPKTLDILSRSVRLGLHVGMTNQNMIEFADAINKADKAIS